MSARGERQIQQWLFEYLQIDIDPYDFQFSLPRWREEAELPVIEEPDVESLTERQRDDFTEWLWRSGEVKGLLQNDPLEAPAYLTLHSEDMLPKGTWLIHFTRTPGFREFDRGTDLRGLHLSTWKRVKDTVDCEKNLEADRGIFEVIYGFAYEAEAMRREQALRGSQYGDYALLFQCDSGVLAYHDGDQERQVIFPLCSEYNVVQLSIDGGFQASKKNGDDILFENLGDVIDYVDRHRGRATRLQGYG